jgi:hypothetical protein
MDWLDLLTPSAAVLALFIAIGLVVQSIRHGRAIRRLEQGLAQAGGVAVEASLERIQQLQARANISSGEATPPSALLRRAGVIVATVVAILMIGGLTWAFFLRDGGGDDALAGGGKDQTISTPSGTPQVPPDQSTVPDDLPPLQNKSLYNVAVLNATEVSGVATNVIAPRVTNEGYTVPYIGDAPEKGLQTSVVMYAKGQKRVGQNVADDLGIADATPLDGLSEDQIGGAETDAVVLIGEDLAGKAAEEANP